MKSLIFVFALVLLPSCYTAVMSQESQTHNGRVIGSYALGSMEVTMIYDLDSECDRKTSPHTAGIFSQDENVEINLYPGSETVEIIKEGLAEQVFATTDCYATARSGANQVSISCAGSCDCSLEGVLSGDNSHVSCSCNECTMEITFISVGLHSNDTTEYTLNDPATMEVPFVAEYLTFADSSYVLQEVTVYRNGSDEAALFSYIDANGVASTVMFARASGKTYRISCEGECGCREVYSFETNSASCSCEDCVMTVEEVSNQ